MDENLVMILILVYLALIGFMYTRFGVIGLVALALLTLGWIYFFVPASYHIDYPEYKFFIVDGEPVYHVKDYVTKSRSEHVDIAYYQCEDFDCMDLATDAEGRTWKLCFDIKIENAKNPDPVVDAHKLLSKWVQNKAKTMKSFDFYDWGYNLHRKEINDYMYGKISGIKSSDYMLSMIYCTSDPQYNMDNMDLLTEH